MIGFKDAEAAGRASARIAKLSGRDLGERFLELFSESPDPDLALANFERWLSATTNADAQLEHLLASPGPARIALTLFGASQPLADALVQNPELATLITDPEALQQKPASAAVAIEGNRLLAVASGYSHALDRLRFLKQRWLVRIAANDLAGIWSQEDVWTAISELADGLIELAHVTAWREYSAQKGLRLECPVAVVSFGKLAGKELNYSSDVDLVYVTRDGLEETEERHAVQFCEMLTRALGERMGRGSLYRVDLRLRPFGGAGPVAQSMRSVEAYYRSHAQVWEAQALVRSRIVTGNENIRTRWEALRLEHCFRPQTSSAALEEIAATRRRIEKSAPNSDVKRGAGGIRDVEFLTQLLQLVHGHAHESVRNPNTLDAIKALLEIKALKIRQASDLSEGYRFLRKLEHRCQIVGDRQTHSIPEDKPGRERLARMMGHEHWSETEGSLDSHRRRIRRIYEAAVANADETPEPRDVALDALGELAREGAAWLDALPESEAFYRSLVENRDSIERIRKFLFSAPALAKQLGRHLGVTEALLSGEIEEPPPETFSIEEAAPTAHVQRFAELVRGSWVWLAARWALKPEEAVGPRLSRLYDETLKGLTRRLNARFDVIALGSYATGDTGLNSDLDLLLLIRDPKRHAAAEERAEELLSVASGLRRYGAPISIDLRLRPEGAKGLLVRTYEGLSAYDLHGMEMWERLALGECRIVAGDPDAAALVKKIAYAQPLTPERFESLLNMKSRMETERVPIKYRRRHVKLGEGGLSDIEWFVRLHEMRYPTATAAGVTTSIDKRLKAMGHAHLINTLELEALLDARAHLLALRNRLVLLGLTTDVVPENPDKLDILARASGFKDGNKFLAAHQRITAAVRSIYSEGLERLRA